jgi:hypothetical protein
VPERVVDCLEVVQVEVEQRDGLRALDGAGEALLEVAAVREAGQAVVVGVVGAAARCDGAR